MPKTNGRVMNAVVNISGDIQIKQTSASQPTVPHADPTETNLIPYVVAGWMDSTDTALSSSTTQDAHRLPSSYEL